MVGCLRAHERGITESNHERGKTGVGERMRSAEEPGNLLGVTNDQTKDARGRIRKWEWGISARLAANSILAHINGQTEAVPSGVVSVDPIVDSDGGTIIDSPLPSAHLGARPWWVRTSVLSVHDRGFA